MYAFCMDLIEHNELHNVGPPVLTNVLLTISLLNYMAHPPILSGPDEAAPSRQQLNQYKFTMEWLVECISHVAQPNCTLQLHHFKMICCATHTYKLCAINHPKNVGPVAFLEALWPVSSGCMDCIIQLIPGGWKKPLGQYRSFSSLMRGSLYSSQKTHSGSWQLTQATRLGSSTGQHWHK